MGQPVRGNGANGHSASGTARMADGAFVDALVFYFGGNPGRCAVLVRRQLDRGVARCIFLFTYAVCGIRVVSLVLRAAKPAAVSFGAACRFGVCRLVRVAMAGDLSCGRGGDVDARALAFVYADFAMHMPI